MADIPQAAPAPTPANGVSVTPTAAPAAAPVAPVAAPAPVAQVEPPKESWFKGFDWMKVIGYSVLVIVGVAYVKYTRDRATKDAADIASLKSQLSSLTVQVDSLTPAS